MTAKTSPKEQFWHLNTCDHVLRASLLYPPRGKIPKWPHDHGCLSFPTNIFEKEELPSSSLGLKTPKRISCPLLSSISIKQKKENRQNISGGTLMMPADISRDNMVILGTIYEESTYDCYPI